MVRRPECTCQGGSCHIASSARFHCMAPAYWAAYVPYVPGGSAGAGMGTLNNGSGGFGFFCDPCRDDLRMFKNVTIVSLGDYFCDAIVNTDWDIGYGHFEDQSMDHLEFKQREMEGY